MKVLVTGADGQLGRALALCNDSTHSVLGLSKEECDILDPMRIQRIIAELHPDAVIHCAAYTAVDLAEKEIEHCRRVNISGTANVAKVCDAYNIALMLMSTDYVFSGEGDMPYEVYQKRNPLNQYGRSKAEAEDIVRKLRKNFIVRTSWMFGDGSNFIKTICRLAQHNSQINVVADQIGSPTYAADLAPLLLKILEKRQYGIYHATNEGFCSWADLAKFSINIAHLEARICPVTSDEYGSPAQRPKNSRLSKKCLTNLGLERLPHWEDAVIRYLTKLKGLYDE